VRGTKIMEKSSTKWGHCVIQLANERGSRDGKSAQGLKYSKKLTACRIKDSNWAAVVKKPIPTDESKEPEPWLVLTIWKSGIKTHQGPKRLKKLRKLSA